MLRKSDFLFPPEAWDLPVRRFFIPYVEFCEIRGEEPNPEFMGMLVRVFDGEARLVGDEGGGP